MRFISVLAAALLLCAGCATEQAAPPLLPSSANVSGTGVIAFRTAGSLARSVDGRRFEPGPPEIVSGELRLPAARGARALRGACVRWRAPGGRRR